MKEFEKVNFEKTTPTTAKNKARAAMVNFLTNVMSETFGKEFVSIVGASEISVCIGVRKDADGFDHEVCVNLAPTAKDVEDRVTSKGVYEAYDRLNAADNYEIEKKKKDDKAEEKEKEKAAKLAKLEEAKKKKEEEKKKRLAEKLKEKNQKTTQESTEITEATEESAENN